MDAQLGERWQIVGKNGSEISALTRISTSLVHSIVKKYRVRCRIYGRRTLNELAPPSVASLIRPSCNSVVKVLLPRSIPCVAQTAHFHGVVVVVGR